MFESILFREILVCFSFIVKAVVRSYYSRDTLLTEDLFGDINYSFATALAFRYFSDKLVY